METVWIVTCEVLVAPDDLPSGCTKAFVNLTTWADSVEVIRKSVSRYMETSKWHLISIEDAHPIDDKRNYDEEVIDMIERARENPGTIILGRFFSYKEN